MLSNRYGACFAIMVMTSVGISSGSGAFWLPRVPVTARISPRLMKIGIFSCLTMLQASVMTLIVLSTRLFDVSLATIVLAIVSRPRPSALDILSRSFTSLTLFAFQPRALLYFARVCLMLGHPISSSIYW